MRDRLRHICILQFFDPFLHYLDIAQVTQALEKSFAGFLHGLPVGVGIEGHQSVGKRAAAAQRDTQIVHSIGVEIGGDVLTFFERSKHPVAEAGGLFTSCVRVG